jgi:hypothetical protein
LSVWLLVGCEKKEFHARTKAARLPMAMNPPTRAKCVPLNREIRQKSSVWRVLLMFFYTVERDCLKKMRVMGPKCPETAF